MPSKSRLAFIDLLRGWAVLVMVEVHVFNAFIRPDIRTEDWFKALNFINGLVAPSFIFISGFVFVLTSQKKIESFRSFGYPFWKQLGRIGLVLLTGYALHLPFYSLHRIITDTVEKGWLVFYQSDVLHCIAIGLLLLFLLRLAINDNRVYRAVLFLGGLIVIGIAPFIWNIDFINFMPAPLAAYMNGQHYSIFPLFPWMGFMLFGGFFAMGYSAAREAGREQVYISRLALVGALVMVGGAIIDALPIHIHIASSDIRANPFFFLERLGIVLLLLTICWYYAAWRHTERSFVLDAGRESLMVYAAHLLVIFGQFWQYHSLYFYYGKSAGVVSCIVATLVLVTLMVAAAKLWEWLKQNHLPLARVMFWIFAGTTLLVFILK